MPATWRDLPVNDWVALNAKLRGLIAALNARGTFTDPLPMAGYFLWVDATGDLRIKNSTPTTDLDGTVVGTQT